ncbi:MAG: hypothetical protein QXV57_06860 [Thermoproteota archaeon]
MVTFTALIWIYGETVKDKTIFDVLVSMISLLAFFIVALKLFVKKLIPTKLRWLRVLDAINAWRLGAYRLTEKR